MTSRARELAQVPSVPSGRRNLIINGDMKVAQRGTSFTNKQTSLYTLDRMRLAGSSLDTARFDVEQSTNSPEGFAYSYKVTTATAEGAVNAADIAYGLVYKIEGQDLQHLEYSNSSAKPITVSFWVQSNTTGTYVLSLYNPDNTRNVGKTYTISSANTWEYKTLTFAGDTTDGFNNDTGSSLELYFITGSGTQYTSGTLPATWADYVVAGFAAGQGVQLQNTLNATWQITGLQVEVGNVATEFEYRSFSEDLTLCQRYFERFNYSDGGMVGVVSLQNTSGGWLPFYYSEKRANPSFSSSAAGQTTGTLSLLEGGGGYPTTTGSVAAVYATPKNVRLNFTGYSGLTGGAGYSCVWYSTGDTFVDIDAEL